MTNLKTVNMGMNKYCGPAVLSILTGKSTDECARVISSINGQYNIVGVYLEHLLKAANKMGFDTIPVTTSGSTLYAVLTKLVNNNGMYIISVPSHFVCIEVNDKKIYFCDNHTKEPMPAASSARLLQKVLDIHKVSERPKPPEPKLIKTRKLFEVQIVEELVYDQSEHNKKKLITWQTFDNVEQLEEFIRRHNVS